MDPKAEHPVKADKTNDGHAAVAITLVTIALMAFLVYKVLS